MVANVIKVKTSNNSGPSCSKGGYYTTHWMDCKLSSGSTDKTNHAVN